MSRQRDNTGHKPGRQPREEDPVYKAKAKMVASMSLQGMTNAQIATVVGQDSRTVQRYRTFAKDQGYMEAVRKDLSERLLPQATDFYEELMGTPIAKLQESPKGYKLKLDAAKDLAAGLGAFRKESASTSKSLKGTVDLDEYLKIRALKNDLDGTRKLGLNDNGSVIDVTPIPVRGANHERLRGHLPGPVGDSPEGERERQGELFGDLDLPAWESLAGEVGRGGDPRGTVGDRGTERQAGAPPCAGLDARGEGGAGRPEEVVPIVDLP